MAIDTPGFDDTGRTNVEILKEIIASLTKLYKRGGQILVMIYLHCITDSRVSGSALKTPRDFQVIDWCLGDAYRPDREYIVE